MITKDNCAHYLVIVDFEPNKNNKLSWFLNMYFTNYLIHRFFVENLDNRKVEKFDFGHSFLENVAKIIKKRVLARRGDCENDAKKTDEMDKEKLKVIENELKNIKLILKELKTKILSKQT